VNHDVVLAGGNKVGVIFEDVERALGIGGRNGGGRALEKSMATIQDGDGEHVVRSKE